MAHLFGQLTAPAAGVYYIDSAETGKIAQEVTFMGNDVASQDFATDGSEHMIIRQLVMIGAGNLDIRRNTDGERVVSVALNTNSPHVMDFGEPGLRVEAGVAVTMPATSWLTIIYDKVAS